MIMYAKVPASQDRGVERRRRMGEEGGGKGMSHLAIKHG
jgi:hypothetical protein